MDVLLCKQRPSQFPQIYSPLVHPKVTGLISSQLQGAALATLLTLTVSMILKCCWSLSPLLNGLVNGLLFLIWAAGLGLLINAMRATILRQCTVDYWGDQTGVYVCISYKLLLAFATTGT
jgi:hypothetical protein